MPRRIYLCSYDVADDKRRTRLFDILKDHGEHVQFSLFLCELSPPEYARLVALCRPVVHDNADQLLLLDLGSSSLEWTQSLAVLGKPWTPSVRCHII
jgi:CRISPR-associated protein Cas2